VTTSILAFAFVIGILVFVHELGHFLAARRIGVRVLTFSLGFGPKLLSVRRGDTEYCLSAIPLGGYVKMAGENAEDARTGADDEFLSKSKWQRFQVLIMGPVMNLVLALVVMAIVLYQGAQVPAFDREPVIIGSVFPSSVEAAAGIQRGDRIVSVNGSPVSNWEEFSWMIAPKANRQVTLGIIRNGEEKFIQFTPKGVGKYEAAEVGILPIMHPEITAVNKGEPAAQAGLQPGDVIMAAGNDHDVSRDRVIELIKSHESQPLPLDILRGGTIRQIVVTPQRTNNVVRIGATISATQVRTVKPGILEAFQLSAERNWEWTKMIVNTLVGLFTRETSIRQLMGPVGIADVSGTAAEQGWISLFGLMAMLSLNLGLINLMPVPVLDGGHITILALEGLSRRDFSIKVKEKMLLAGFVLLVTLMATVIYNDLTRIQWIEKLMPWR
jgi:regulator of sigma E protease